ncbi:MAG TPA: histidine phosphatase family protein, partial [Ruminiclostridium sp.]|nr:histidine phosphatase family protein [Ruminiclostridium sp.]
KDTASITLKKMNREAVILPWLREFNAPIIDERTGEQRIPWDWLPSEWTKVDEYYQKNLWHRTPIMQMGNVGKEASRVHAGLDELLKMHGYEREEQIYRAVHPNKDTIVLFCHFGVECVILGHLIGVSPMVLWHGMCAAPTSVTTLVTEERRKSIASFRMSSFGDISHLYAAGEEPAFAARFCETYDDLNQRHD